MCRHTRKRIDVLAEAGSPGRLRAESLQCDSAYSNSSLTFINDSFHMILLEIKQILHRKYLLPHHIVDINSLVWQNKTKPLNDIKCEEKNVNNQNSHTI